ncbi:MAG: YceI family protein [Gammaproteobacteria bacterium]|jgi:polyisoprenoid-binding protein YceI
MKHSVLPSLVLSALLVLAADSSRAEEPCAPFEDGRVDARLLAEMRTAAQDGRLYRVLPGNSKVAFCVRYFPFQEFRGEFRNLVGGLTLPPDLERHGRALLLIHTTSMESSNPDLDALVQSHEFMDVERFPDILFVGRAFQWYNPLQAYIYGDLTLRGITQPVVFNIEVDVLDRDANEQPEIIHLRGTGEVNRTEFDMRTHQIMISQNVRLCLSVDLIRWE